MNTYHADIPITIRGRYLWRGDDRFFVRGVTYQDPGDICDPIADDRLPKLKRDLLLFRELGLNTLRVCPCVSIDNTKSHDKAMELLAEAGIYVLTNVTTPHSSINRMDPYSSYSPIKLQTFFKTIDVMASYPNTLGLFAASELINSDRYLSVAPVVKAVVRDMKKHMRLRNEAVGQRILPIGYNGAKSGLTDRTILEYLCFGEKAIAIDFWTCKNYSWAGDSDMSQSGYNDLIAQFRPTGIPIFLSEYGSIVRQPRLFTETKALYSPEMSQVFSGGCVYDFWEGANRYGLVALIKDEEPRSRQASWQRGLGQAEDACKTFELREREDGLLLVFHDFANHKANLAAAVEGLVGQEESWEGDIGTVQSRNEPRSWPWEPEFSMPECYVDWGSMMRASAG